MIFFPIPDHTLWLGITLISPSNLPVHILALQRTPGNQGVKKLTNLA
jgi:hypothetical protein